MTTDGTADQTERGRMVDERESPSAGWREVYHEMDADPNAEEATRPCPDCGRTCQHVVRDAYECDEHGVFRASASGGESADADSPDADPPDADETRRARGPVRSD